MREIERLGERRRLALRGRRALLSSSHRRCGRHLAQQAAQRAHPLRGRGGGRAGGRGGGWGGGRGGRGGECSAALGIEAFGDEALGGESFGGEERGGALEGGVEARRLPLCTCALAVEGDVCLGELEL